MESHVHCVGMNTISTVRYLPCTESRAVSPGSFSVFPWNSKRFGFHCRDDGFTHCRHCKGRVRVRVRVRVRARAASLTLLIRNC